MVSNSEMNNSSKREEIESEMSSSNRSSIPEFEGIMSYDQAIDRTINNNP